MIDFSISMVVLAVFVVVPAPQAEWVEARVPEALHEIEARTVELGPDGALWIGVRERGVVRVGPQGLSWFSSADGLASNDIADVSFRPGGALWATGRGGIARFDGAQWVAAQEVGSSTIGVAFSVTEDPGRGVTWVATNDGAARIEDGRATWIRQADGLPHAVVHAVLPDASGGVWLACRRGLARWRDGEMEVFFPEVNFRSALVDPDGQLWFGTSDGVYRWSGSTWDQALEGRTILPRLVDSRGAIWAVGADAELLRHSRGSWAPVPLPDRFSGSEVFDVAEAADGSIWLATSSGIGRLVAAGPPS